MGERRMSLETLERASAATTEVPLWPEGPPEPSACGPGPEQWFQQDAGGAPTNMLRNVVTPTLTVYRPAKANGVGVIVAPGGGWRILAWEHEGTDLCDWLTARGYTAFLLKYRLRGTPPDPADYAAQMAKMMGRIAPPKSNATAPRSFDGVLKDPELDKARAMALADGQRALALVRERAAEWGVKPDRIGMIGFSAGGFLTCDVAMEPGGAPLAFAAPIYGGETRGRPVPADAPPLFTAVATDDLLLFKCTEQMYLDWSNADRPAEIHVYRRGGHGFGMAKQGFPSDRWVEPFEAWMADLGYA
jgi:dienelactone hydrolase